VSQDLDKTELAKRVRLQIFGHPLFVWPTVAGMGTLTVAALASSGVVAFVGLALLMSGALKLSHGWLFAREFIEKKTLEQVRAMREAQAQQEIEDKEQKLDGLRERLIQDQDPRTEQHLDDLRALVNGFKDDRSWMQGLNFHTSSQLNDVVNNLFVSCVDRLERTLELQKMIDSISSEASEQLNTSREMLLEDVRGGIKSLSNVLVGIQTVGVRHIAEASSVGGSVKENTEELQRILETAQKVQENLSPKVKEEKSEKFRKYLKAAKEAETKVDGPKEREYSKESTE
jgi:hypothetical protein